MTINVNQRVRQISRGTRVPTAQSADEPSSQNSPANPDQVRLGSGPQNTPNPQAAVVPVEETKEDKGPLDLRLSDLSRPLKNGKAKDILAKIDPEMTLPKLTKHLFDADPAADSNSTFQLHFSESDSWRNLAISSTRKLSNGEVVSRVNIGRSHEDSEIPKPRFSLDYKPEQMPTGNQLPDLLQTHWGSIFHESPTELAAGITKKYGDLGEQSDVRIYLSGIERDKPYVSMSWQAKSPRGVKSNLSLGSEQSVRLSQSLSPDQMSKPELMSPAVVQAWSDSGIDPIEMVAGMFKGAIAKPETVDLGIRTDKKGSRVTVGVSMMGRRGKLKGEKAGRVAFSFFDRTDDKGKTTKHAYHDLLNFTKEFQGRGLAKSILANQFELYEQQKIDKVDLYAAITVGGYAWAKYGWQLKPEEVKENKLDKQIKTRLESLDLKPKTRKVVETILKSKSSKKNWALADLKQKVLKDGKEITLAKALLLGTRWAGTFDMHDKASRKRLERYLG